MTALKLDFPYNLLISAKLGNGETIDNKDGTFSYNVPIIIKESLLFKIIKLVRSIWQVA